MRVVVRLAGIFLNGDFRAYGFPKRCYIDAHGREKRNVDYVKNIHVVAHPNLVRAHSKLVSFEYTMVRTHDEQPLQDRFETINVEPEKVILDGYQCRNVADEEMSERDMDTLAMSIATYLFERLQKQAIAEMKICMPDYNPLNDPTFFTEGESE